MGVSKEVSHWLVARPGTLMLVFSFALLRVLFGPGNFGPDCGEETAHEGFDELGPGWYAQICRCRLCGRQDMKVWALSCW